jgi:hypothetical protein
MLLTAQSFQRSATEYRIYGKPVIDVQLDVASGELLEILPDHASGNILRQCPRRDKTGQQQGEHAYRENNATIRFHKLLLCLRGEPQSAVQASGRLSFRILKIAF